MYRDVMENSNDNVVIENQLKGLLEQQQGSEGITKSSNTMSRAVVASLTKLRDRHTCETEDTAAWFEN